MMSIKEKEYNDLKDINVSEYLDQFYEDKFTPVEGSKYIGNDGVVTLKTLIDDKDRVLWCIYGVGENIQDEIVDKRVLEYFSKAHNGFKVTGLNAWKKLFEDIEESDFLLHLAVKRLGAISDGSGGMCSNGKGRYEYYKKYDYIWFESDNENFLNLPTVKEKFFNIKNNVYIYFLGKDD